MSAGLKKDDALDIFALNFLVVKQEKEKNLRLPYEIQEVWPTPIDKWELLVSVSALGGDS